MSAKSASCEWFKQLLPSLGIAKESLKAIVVFSGHWETDGVVAINNKAKHSLYYDYGGFPPHTYQLEFPAPGHPELASRIDGLLKGAGFATRFETKRGLDHGVFIPLKLVFPEADVPLVEVSMPTDVDADTFFRLGAALTPLRSEGVLIIGSGFATHGRTGGKKAQEWMDWLTSAVEAKPTESDSRLKRLAQYQKAPNYRLMHPTEDHFVPLLIAAGAAQDTEPGTRIGEFAAPDSSMYLTSYRFG